jgi:hypothetical protein
MEEVLNQSADTNVAPTSSETSTPQEKMLRQSEVNEIVGRAKQEAANRAVENYKRSMQQEAQAAPVYKESSSEFNEERFRRLAAEEAQRLRDQWIQEAQSNAEEQAAKRIVKNFYDKIEVGKQKYDDFDKVTGDLELRRFPNTVHMLAENLENASDVLYELSKNRSKLAQIELTARDFPQEALYELNRLSDSIKKNESVTGHRETNTPLNQQRSSNVGTDSSSVLSMPELKAKYRA